ncbi:MAG: AAA family ATPase [Sphingomonas sp.]|uniref:AAA family ATPase n=1 Tax=Sphingomonas sp. TaxID=28214 RepID=UPI0025FAAB08|nr:AAA family ATPase [Sphingomonas sp.]MBY0284993.1 AAA family ATPase [Sphingomonas sp.]
MLRIRHIRLRAETTGGLYGTDVRLNGGLTVLHAPNTSGKSTVLHAFLYALGLEQMLSPRREIPLSYAMRDYVQNPANGVEHKILESYVAVEIENGSGQMMTVRRNVIAEGDRRLISVIGGPELTEGPGDYARRDYFVIDAGGAQREAGFHRLLVEFMSWNLPTVKRFDGGDCPLYVETLFPLFFVEQKVGWTAIPGAIPTQFRIREVHRRSVEFLMDFDTHDMELRRQDLELRMGAARTDWAKSVDAIVALATASGFRVARLPMAPTALGSDIENAYLEYQQNGEWLRVQTRIAALAEQLETLKNESIPEVEGVVEGAAAEAEALSAQIMSLNTERSTIFRDRQAELVQQASTAQRIAQLEEDLQKNKDALKLQNFGSRLSRELDPNHCPTCEQAIDQSLLPQGTLESVMSIEDNIEYLSAQRKVFKRLVDRSVAMIRGLDLELVSTGEDVRRKSARLRALKSDLIAPSHAASAAFIEERLRVEQELFRVGDTMGRFEQQLDALNEQARVWRDMLAERAALPEARLSDEDVGKLLKLETSIRSQLVRYGFGTFPAKDLTVSHDSYRPEKEGFEIGFELSASDSIRLKWAYQLGLLDVAHGSKTNHPGLVVFDEPRQQEAAEASVAMLLSEASRIAKGRSQILIATSEDLSKVKGFLEGFECQLLVFDGKMIAPISDDAGS